ncbi:RagB/SusD family nutrient uptake outer membrane protein [Halosquirtibacter laminarini]|uniref:RagB/SusD family nutrient uptake outer membrane protein n=1 Tax=Halosquirtibacter laminarini TaxID=3374600 RepID=A0AC61NQX2_9BACT|nr:RagB/SusD family nutrient uptake outer membrane protein [Prolixibacteraceae bacterium]
MNKIYIALSLIATILLSSCSDFLDITPVGKVIPTTLEDYRALLTDGYAQSNNNKSLAGFRTDDYNFFGGWSASKYVEHFFWNENNGDANSSVYDYMNQYQTIFICNQVIAAKGVMTEGSIEDQNQLVAEAYALRAMTYFDLVNIFADVYDAATASSVKAVPLVVSPDIQLDGEFNKASVEVIYNQILSDLKEANSLSAVVIQNDENLTYRFSQVSINALHAKACLLMNNWKEAIAYSKKVLEEKSELQNLNTSTDNFLTFKSSENILSIHRAFISSSQKNSIIPSDDLVVVFDTEGSLRKDVMLTSDNKIAVLAESKYKTTFRVPEVMLILAEASLRLGTPNVAGARSQLKKLVDARYSTAAATILKASIDTMNREELLVEVYKQRRTELAFQGKRWIDLRRNGKPTITHKYKGDSGEREEILTHNDSRYVIKFPVEAIRLNPNLANK